MDTIRPWLLVGRYIECLSRQRLRSAQVGAILQVATPVLQPGIACHFVPTLDGEPLPEANLRSGVDFIRQQKAAGRVVLVACAAGISRSVTFAIAALHEEEGLPLLEAFASLHQAHPDALPHPHLWQSLCDYYQEQVPYQRVLDILSPPFSAPRNE